MQTHRAPAPNASPLELRLRSFGPLSPEDVAILDACLGDTTAHPVGTDLCRSDQPSPPQVILSGWAAWHSILDDGRRQIARLLLPGDVVGLPPPPGGVVAALTPVLTGDARPLAAALEDPAHRGLRAAWAAARRRDQQQLLDQIVRLGRCSAYERTARLMMELMDRLGRAGLAEAGAMPWPLTQEMLADVLGLSIVHMNRTLQQLRREGVIVLRAGRATIPDLGRLASTAGVAGRP